METQAVCIEEQLSFQGISGRRVEARFDGGRVSSDGGLLLIRELVKRCGILKRFADCFEDFRNPKFVIHPLERLLEQRLYGLIAGYEDLNDHDALRKDPLLQELFAQGEDLASRNTLNRMELTRADASKKERYKKILCRIDAVERFLVGEFLRQLPKDTEEIVLDLDATDFPLHGEQEQRFFHGYYNCYCYLPLYILCGDHLLCAKLRPSNIDGSAGSLEEVQKIVVQLRNERPGLRIILRADSGFARDSLLSWCEENAVDFIIGMAQNPRLRAEIKEELELAEKQFQETNEPARLFKEFSYRTLDSWSRERRVIAKAEHLRLGENPRFIVTSLSTEVVGAAALYEKRYCMRGDAENRIKEQLTLFADRMSTSEFRSNQIRLLFSSVAYVIMTAFRRTALRGTVLQNAQFDTIRLKLFKIGARIIRSTRRVFISLPQSFPHQTLFALILARLQAT